MTGKKNGRAPLPSAMPATLTPLLAAGIAHGSAGSAFELVAGHVDDQPPRGRYWYTGGAYVEPDVAGRHIESMADFVAAHPGAPAEALYRHVCGDLVRKWRGDFGALPLADQMAFEVFVANAATLVPKARALAEAARQAAVAARFAAPLPDKGIFRRLRRQKRTGRRVELTHPTPRQEAAE